MSLTSKSMMGVAFAVASLFVAVHAQPAEHSKTAGTKVPFTVKRGDCELTMGGKAKIEQYCQPHITMLNRNIPDEPNFFKQTVDLTFDVVYGKEKYGHKAAELFLDLRHKGVWGKATSYADKDSGPVGPASVRLSDSVFGAHSHVSGKSLVWFNDAWLSFSLNSVFGCESEKIHNLKFGWFSFELGRGIALGSVYGVNKEGFGLYSYQEDKSAPGILAHGELMADKLSYDLYFARFEERNKGFGDSISMVKRHWVDQAKAGTVWRGVAKNDDLFAARVQWKPFNDHEKVGTLEIEPYIFYNVASDQKVEVAPDAKTEWGSYGLMFEHEINGFEYGAEVAFNYGTEYVKNIDRNAIEIKRDKIAGTLIEQYTHIFTDAAGASPAPVTDNSKKFAANYNRPQNTGTSVTSIPVPTGGTGTFWDGPSGGLPRFRPAYQNTFHGWMGVFDMAYTFKNIDLKVALSYAYASGDVDPHDEAKNKRYNGFIGLHEWYSGSRVSSVMLLDDASIMRPTTLGAGQSKPKVSTDWAFSDLQLVGIGATWKPKGFARDFSVNPNVLGYWKAYEGYAYDAANKQSSTNKARPYLGTEFNLIAKCSLLKDLTFTGKFGLFQPGAFYSDMKGVPLSDDKFKQIEEDPRNDINDATSFRLSDDMAYHINCGLEFKF